LDRPPGEHSVAASDDDKTLRLWSLLNGEAMHVLQPAER